MEANKYLLLYLDAPMQSWGYQSKFDRRTSLGYPTKSGIAGMLCAAMGIAGAAKKILSQISLLKMTVYVLSLPNRIEDFHTIGGGYDKKANPMNVPKTADGKKGKTVISRREYLADAKFAVSLFGQTEFLGQIEKALKKPVWGIWLGRKSCVPASPVCRGIFKSERHVSEYINNNLNYSVHKKIIESQNFDDGIDTLMDVAIDFKKREFAPRRILVE